ncbi:DUF6338 family protein [Actinokineospora cianjurensis]|uniref:Uncharacterized protein n=1 Tax=Actinokineospora cianjurensis TaxID=585224 RepID=A0A421B3E0_9PSEU|nr:DUF6338 family protein [Actinokineospora cianjurensis]RLK58942.1 hypothetical protein CLV68_3423 [Actinokineospora cianjurensis]
MPATPIAVAIFLLVAVPGVVLELLRQRTRPGRHESVFVETSRVLLGGVAVSGVSLVALGLLRTAAGAPLVDPRALVLRPAYVVDNLWLVGGSTELFLSVSTTLAALYHYSTAYPGLHAGIVPESAWVTVFARWANQVAVANADQLVGKRLVTQVQVDLEDGTAYIGTRESYSADVPQDNREIVLTRPLLRVDAKGDAQPLDAKWQHVIISNTRVSAIRVLFTTTASSGDTGGGGTVRGTPRVTKVARFLTTDRRGLWLLLFAQLAIPAVIGFVR